MKSWKLYITFVCIIFIITGCNTLTDTDIVTDNTYTIYINGDIETRAEPFTKTNDLEEPEDENIIITNTLSSAQRETPMPGSFISGNYYGCFIIFDSSGRNVYTSATENILITNNNFSLKAQVPENTSGQLYLFVAKMATELPDGNKIRTIESLEKHWSAHQGLSQTDILPLCGNTLLNNNTGQLDIIMYHIGSKLTLQYKINSNANFIIDSVCLGNVSGRNYWLATSAGQASNTADIDRYAVKCKTQKEGFTFYFPENKQLTNSYIKSPKDKNKKNAPFKATYIELCGRQASNKKRMTLRIYPGMNMTSDFNIRRNGHYTVNLTINHLDPDDPRVTIENNNAPVLIFDILNVKNVNSFSYSGSPKHELINPTRVCIKEKNENIGKIISDITVNQKTITGNIKIKAGTNYYTLDYNYGGLGGGTEDNPYLIYNKAQFLKIPENLSAYYKQMEDIIYLGYHIPYGSEKHPFTGGYDGNHKQLSQVNMINIINSGLFGYTNNATLKNINLHITITLSNSSNRTGAIVASANNSNIENCYITGGIDISNPCNIIGGIVGSSFNSNITNNQFAGYIRVNTQTATYVGGITGYAENSYIADNDFTKVTTFSFLPTTSGGAIVGGSKNNHLRNNLFAPKYKETGILIQ
ncbi:MAG: hypothetical protein ACRCX4_01765 [Bacteroidales bacterium]